MPFGWYMGRRQGPVISLAIFTIMLSGCLAAPVASWGDDSGEISTSRIGDEVTISADMNQYPGDYGPFSLIGCGNLDGDGNADKNIPAAKELVFSGYMANSILYETHSDDLKDGRDLGTVAAVIIDSMSMQAADEVVEGTGPKVFVKDWISPTYPTTASGAGLDPVKKEGAKFLSLALIPASENIIDGIHALETWHQAIEVHGYIMVDNKTSLTGIEKSSGSCSIKIDENANAHVFVTEIRLASGVVSEDGEDKDEWAMGDVDYLGRWGFIAFFLLFGVGGAFGAFILSNMLLMRQAKNTAKTLMGEEGYKKAEKMRKDLRKSKKNKFDDGALQRAPPKKEPKKPPKEEKKPEPESKLAGFSLDNILSKGSSLDSTNSISGGGGVTVTAEAVNMVNQNEQMSQSAGGNVSGGFGGGGVSGGGVSGGGVSGGFAGGSQSGGGDSHFSSNSMNAPISSMNTPIERPDKPMKKRRAAKKQSASSQQSSTQQSSSSSAPGPKRKGGPPPAKQQRPSVSESDFDDFSDL